MCTSTMRFYNYKLVRQPIRNGQNRRHISNKTIYLTFTSFHQSFNINEVTVKKNETQGMHSEISGNTDVRYIHLLSRCVIEAEKWDCRIIETPIIAIAQIATVETRSKTLTKTSLTEQVSHTTLSNATTSYLFMHGCTNNHAASTQWLHTSMERGHKVTVAEKASLCTRVFIRQSTPPCMVSLELQSWHSAK